MASMPGTIFLTGGNGKTTQRVAEELARISPMEPVLRSSRSPGASTSSSSLSSGGGDDHNHSNNIVAFDWMNSSTYDNVFKHLTDSSSYLSAIYIVLPPIEDPLPHVRAFIEKALGQHKPGGNGEGELILVLLSAGCADPGPDALWPHGRVHDYLIHLASQASASATHKNTKVSYAALRPSFFMENLSEAEPIKTINDPKESTVYSARGTGAEALVSVADIAAVAARCLLGRAPLNHQYYISGPEMLTYDEAVQVISKVSGRHVTHTKVTTAELIDRYRAEGVPPDYARMLAGLDEAIRIGDGQTTNDTVETLVGRSGITFQQFADKAKGAWAVK